MEKKLTASELYAAAVEQLPPEHIDHHSYGSDLYLKVTPTSKKLSASFEGGRYVQIFRDQIDGELWFDIPFAYIPFWENLPR